MKNKYEVLQCFQLTTAGNQLAVQIVNKDGHILLRFASSRGETLISMKDFDDIIKRIHGAKKSEIRKTIKSNLS